MQDKIWLIIIIALLSFGVFFYFLNMIVAARLIIVRTLLRGSKENWGRALQPDATPEQVEMDRIGTLWQAEHNEYKEDVHIVNEGLNLYGEYYDFGHERAVMVLSGRTESLRYGYYFAIPYAKAGFNVLVIDPRGHGFSDGNCNSVGFNESRDALAWTRFLQKEKGVTAIVYHGICIGAATGTYAITDDNCPDCVKAMVTEGMFAAFAYSMKNHLIEKHRNFPTLMFFLHFWFKHYIGYDMRIGPIHSIHKMKTPILMLQSKKDPYSTPENAKKLYERCGSKKKKLVLFEEGGHSLLRITDTEKYDREITAFLKDIFDN